MAKPGKAISAIACVVSFLVLMSMVAYADFSFDDFDDFDSGDGWNDADGGDDGWNDADDGWNDADDGWNDADSGADDSGDAFDDLDNGFDGTDDGFEDLDDGFDDDFDDDFDTYWLQLQDRSITEDSPDSTVAYAGVAQRCVASGTASVSVSYLNQHFEAFISGNDLLVRNLEADWHGSEQVWLLCDGVTASFALNVLNVNDAPMISPPLPAYIIWQVDFPDPYQLDLQQHEHDIDNSHSELAWTLSSAGSQYFQASISGKTLIIMPIAVGSGIITLTLTDPEGAFAAQDINIEIFESGGNDAPSITPAVPNLTVTAGQSLSYSLEPHESDPDNSHSELSWAAVSGNTGVLSAAISGKTLAITPVAAGTASVTLTLTDPDGAFDTQDVTVTVLPQDDDDDDNDDDNDGSEDGIPGGEYGEEEGGIFISRVRLDGELVRGSNSVQSFVTIKNSGDSELENIKITMLVQETPARGSAGPFDLKGGRSVTKSIAMISDEPMAKGTYNIRFTISAGGVRRVVYRQAELR